MTTSLPRASTIALSLLAFATACADPAADGRTDDATDTAATSAAFRRLWVPHYGAGELRGWDADRLDADVDGAPDVVLTLPAGTRPNALAFDADGDLWVTDNAGDRLLEIAAGDLDATGAVTPATTIDSDGASLHAPIGLSFDDAGDLWVAVDGALERYAPDNLDDSGPTTPNGGLATAAFVVPAGLTWGPDGALWVANAAFDDGGANANALLAFAPDQVAAGGAQVPALTVTYDGFALIEGVAFDAAGDLWVSSNDGLYVARFDGADLVLPAAPAVRAVDPTGALGADADDTATGRTIRKPGGLAFDPDGNLFVNSERGPMGGTDSAVVRFGAGQLDGVAGEVAVQADAVVVHATSNPGFGGLVIQP